jgi:hypothetical protein
VTLSSSTPLFFNGYKQALAFSGNVGAEAPGIQEERHLFGDSAPRLRQSPNRAPGGTTKTTLPAMTALLMLGRDVRGA